MDMLVTPEWLASQSSEPDLVILDCTVRTLPTGDGGIRNVSGRADYQKGHIPGAGFADLKGELSDLDAPIEFAVPSPEAFCNAMGQLGVGDDTRVVLYDDEMTAWAARVWWMLRWVGFDRAAVLDGGFSAWRAEGRPVSTEPAVYPARHLTPNVRTDLIADQDEVKAAIDNANVQLIDTLPRPFYTGTETIYARPGHIPSAINICGIDLLDKSGRAKSHDALDALHPKDRDARYITYCGGGILASLNAFTMARLGFTNVAVYTASLQEWAANPALPMETADK